MTLCAGCADRSDLFLIRQQAAGGIGRLLYPEKRIQGRKCADAVVLSVGCDHAAVKAQIPCFPGRNDLKLRREEVVLFHIVLLLQDCQDILLDRILLVLRVLFQLQRSGACEHIQVFACNGISQRLRHLILRKMNQKICHAENRILFVLTDPDIHSGAVLFGDHTVDGERDGRPLILLDATIIVCVQKCHLCILVQRDLLEVKTRGVDMRAQNPKALLNRLRTDCEQCHRLFHPHCVDLVTALQALTLCDHIGQIPVPCLPGTLCNLFYRFPLRLYMVHKILVIFRKRIQVFDLLLIVVRPSVFFSHRS